MEVRARRILVYGPIVLTSSGKNCMIYSLRCHSYFDEHIINVSQNLMANIGWVMSSYDGVNHSRLSLTNHMIQAIVIILTSQ